MGETTSFWSGLISSADFTSLVNGMKEIVPIVLTAVILPLAILRKGLSFIKGLLYTA